MIKASLVTVLTIGLLWSAAGFADDVQPSRTESELLPVATLSVETMAAESKIPSRWRPIHPAYTTTYSDDWLRPNADFDVQYEGALSRASKLRGLSLFTLAELGKARLFLGVTKEGLVGLHFDVLTRYGAEQYLEVVRMPYLKKTGQAAEENTAMISCVSATISPTGGEDSCNTGQ